MDFMSKLSPLYARRMWTFVTPCYLAPLTRSTAAFVTHSVPIDFHMPLVHSLCFGLFHARTPFAFRVAQRKNFLSCSA